MALLPEQRAEPVKPPPCDGTSLRILAVSQPATPGQTAIPSTTVEIALIARNFPGAVTHLDGAHATVSAVLDAMPGHAWVHLACHGAQRSTATDSAFFLHDGQLDLHSLMGTTLMRAELAVLSACQTATGDDQLPEEAAHLAAGMLAAGFRSVVGTMWSIRDADGPILAHALYAALRTSHERRVVAGGDLRVAYALHEATAYLRKNLGEDNFARWVPSVHFGL
jgi:CHAT domain-containing protein